MLLTCSSYSQLQGARITGILMKQEHEENIRMYNRNSILQQPIKTIIFTTQTKISTFNPYALQLKLNLCNSKLSPCNKNNETFF